MDDPKKGHPRSKNIDQKTPAPNDYNVPNDYEESSNSEESSP